MLRPPCNSQQKLLLQWFSSGFFSNVWVFFILTSRVESKNGSQVERPTVLLSFLLDSRIFRHQFDNFFAISQSLHQEAPKQALYDILIYSHTKIFHHRLQAEFILLECRQNTRSLFDAKNSLSDAKVSHELGTLLDSA